MKTEAWADNCLVFFHQALQAQQAQTLSVLADAISEYQTALDMRATLTSKGNLAFRRLGELWAAICESDCEMLYLPHTPGGLLALLYGYLTEHPLTGATGLAAYTELIVLTSSLMRGEWFD